MPSLARASGILLAVIALVPPPAVPASAQPPRVPSRAPSALEEPVRWLTDQLAELIERERPSRPLHPVRGPIDYGEAAARFGAGRGGHVHQGQDVFAPAGTPLVAVQDAVVVETGSDGGRGNYVALYARRARQTYLYLHMQAPSPLAPGARVRRGQTVGALGCTGSCWGDHLHFEIRSGRGTSAPAIDPLPYLRRWRPRS